MVHGHFSVQGEVFTDLVSTLPPSCVRAGNVVTAQERAAAIRLGRPKSTEPRVVNNDSEGCQAF